jgi:hypothetical protein
MKRWRAQSVTTHHKDRLRNQEMVHHQNLGIFRHSNQDLVLQQKLEMILHQNLDLVLQQKLEMILHQNLDMVVRKQKLGIFHHQNLNMVRKENLEMLRHQNLNLDPLKILQKRSKIVRKQNLSKTRPLNSPPRLTTSATSWTSPRISWPRLVQITQRSSSASETTSPSSPVSRITEEPTIDTSM